MVDRNHVSRARHDQRTVSPALALAKPKLLDCGVHAAVEPLLDAIKDPRNISQRSTLVFALEKLNCSEHFLDLFELALCGRPEILVSAGTILLEQGFYITREDVSRARNMLEAEKGNIEDVDYVSLNEILEEMSDFLSRKATSCTLDSGTTSSDE